MRLVGTLLPCVVILGMAGCCRRAEMPEPPPPENKVVTDLPLGIIGETEVVYLPDFTVPFEARIDTGATTSSIDARDVFARSGGESKEYELPVARTVRIKQHGGESLERISVMLTFRMGHLTLEREFTLTDRSKFEYPVLVGRNIINGIAAVDPSRRNVL